MQLLLAIRDATQYDQTYYYYYTIIEHTIQNASR